MSRRMEFFLTDSFYEQLIICLCHIFLIYNIEIVILLDYFISEKKQCIKASTEASMIKSHPQCATNKEIRNREFWGNMSLTV